MGWAEFIVRIALLLIWAVTWAPLMLIGLLAGYACDQLRLGFKNYRVLARWFEPPWDLDARKRQGLACLYCGVFLDIGEGQAVGTAGSSCVTCWGTQPGSAKDGTAQ